MKQIKNIILFIVLLASTAQAQFIKRQFQVSQTETRPGVLYIPADKTKKYPIVMFFHGNGERGPQDGSRVDYLTGQGLPALINNTNWKPNFVMFALQDDAFSGDPNWYLYALNNDPEVSKYWNGNKEQILWTGLSAGGSKILNAISMNLDGVFLSMGAAYPSLGLPLKLSRPIKYIAIHSDNDPVTDWNVSNEAVKQINSVYPNSVKLITEHDYHGSWVKYYDTAYKVDGNKDMYAWAFGTDTIIPNLPNQPPIVNAGRDTTVTTNRVILRGSATDSDGSIVTYRWAIVVRPTPYSFTFSNAYTPITTVSNLLQGTYVFRFYVTDNKGAISTDDVSVNVNLSVTTQVLYANAGLDQSIVGDKVTLNGSKSTGWKACWWIVQSKPVDAPKVVMKEDVYSPIWTASELIRGTYVFRLYVQTAIGKVLTDDVYVTVGVLPLPTPIKKPVKKTIKK